MLMIGEMKLADAAKEAAGNWQKINFFYWYREKEIEKPEQWTISYTHHRDSGLLDLSNAAYIEKELKRFTVGDDPDVVFETHDHWAVGNIDGLSIRVYRDGQITPAFKAFHQIKFLLSGCPVLDDMDYQVRIYEATLENIGNTAWRLSLDYELPDNWQYQVYDWLADNCGRALENFDDQGGWADEAEIKAAFDALEFVRIE